MQQFQKFVGEWWRPGGPYDSLRSLNKLRVPLIQKLCLKQLADHNKTMNNSLKNVNILDVGSGCLLYTSPSPRDQRGSRMPSSA